MGAPAQAYDDEIDLRQYLRVLWKRRWIIVAVTAVSVVIAYLVTRSATPMYEASTTILISRSQSALPLGGEAAAALLGTGRPAVQNYVELLKSRTVITRALEQLRWPDVDPTKDAGRMSSAVTVSPVQGTDQIRVKVRMADPERARELANTLVESFARFNQEMNRLETRSAVEFVQNQLSQVQARLEASETALLKYKERQRLVEPSQEAKARIDKLADLEKMRSATEVSLSETETRLAQLQQQLKAQAPSLTSSTTISTNPIIQNYQLRLADLEVELSGALESLAPTHPRVVALRAEIDEIRRRMGREVERVVSAETQSLNPVFQALTQQYVGLQVDRVALEARRQALGRLIEAERAGLMALPAQELELARLLRDQRVNEEIYVMLRTRYEELRIQEAMVTADVRVVDPAETPRDPVWPRPLLNVAVALFLGAFAGVGLAFVLEVTDTTVHEDEDLERLLGVPVLARIPTFSASPRRAASEGR